MQAGLALEHSCSQYWFKITVTSLTDAFRKSSDIGINGFISPLWTQQVKCLYNS